MTTMLYWTVLTGNLNITLEKYRH